MKIKTEYLSRLCEPFFKRYAVLKIREKSQRQKIVVAMSEFHSKSDCNFLDVFPTDFSLEYMKSVYRYLYDIHFKAD